jgi:hypothetical protein
MGFSIIFLRVDPCPMEANGARIRNLHDTFNINQDPHSMLVHKKRFRLVVLPPPPHYGNVRCCSSAGGQGDATSYGSVCWRPYRQREGEWEGRRFLAPTITPSHRGGSPPWEGGLSH